MLVIYSALQAIPTELSEAGRVDGCGEWRVAWHIKIPAVRPALVLTGVFSIIGTLQLYNDPEILHQVVAGHRLLVHADHGRAGVRGREQLQLRRRPVDRPRRVDVRAVVRRPEAHPAKGTAAHDRLPRWPRRRAGTAEPPADGTGPLAAGPARSWSWPCSRSTRSSPVWWLLVSATKSSGDLFTTNALWFSDFNFVGNIARRLLDQDGIFGRWMLNSVIYGVAGAAMSTVLSGMAGYALAKYPFRGRDLIFNVILGAVLVPATHVRAARCS